MIDSVGVGVKTCFGVVGTLDERAFDFQLCI